MWVSALSKTQLAYEVGSGASCPTSFAAKKTIPFVYAN
jgi:hypothetical protein